MPVNFSASFTKENRQFNGFTDPEIEPKLVVDDIGGERFIVVGVMMRKFFKNDDVQGTRTPTMTYERIEVVLDPDEQELVKGIIKRRLQERTGLTGDPEPDPALIEVDAQGRPIVPEASGAEIVAELDERRAKRAKDEG